MSNPPCQEPGCDKQGLLGLVKISEEGQKSIGDWCKEHFPMKVWVDDATGFVPMAEMLPDDV